MPMCAHSQRVRARTLLLWAALGFVALGALIRACAGQSFGNDKHCTPGTEARSLPSRQVEEHELEGTAFRSCLGPRGLRHY